MVELLLAVAVFAILVTGLIGALVYGRASTDDAGNRARAALLADEGLEAARSIGRAAFANLVNGTYGIVQSGNIWTFSGTNDVSGIYTRQVTVASGIDANHKTITSTITWNGGTGNDTLTAVTQIDNWVASTKLWSAATQPGALDLSSTNDATKVAIAGNYAYVARNTGTPNFAVVNISTPATPVLTGSLTLAGNPSNVFVKGNYAYVSNTSTTGELQIIDISTPATPVLKSTFNAAGTAGAGKGVYVVGNYAYLARAANTATGELTIVDVSNPLSPVLKGAYNNNVNMNEVYVANNYAYLASGADTTELLVINVSLPASPVLAGSLDLTGTTDATTITGQGTVVYVGQGTALSAVNVANPALPALLNTFTAAGVINDVAVDLNGTFAFLGTASTTGEFQAVTITTPSAMTLSKTLDITGTTSTINGVAYSTSQNVVIGASAADTLEALVVRPN